MRHVILIGLGVTLGLFALLGLQNRAEAPGTHPTPDSAPASDTTDGAGESSAQNDLGQKRAMLYFGKVSIPVWLAATEEERVRGLGNKDTIAENEGMLFVFKTSDLHGIWMRGMRFSIDILWLTPAQNAANCAPNYTEERKCLVVVDIREGVAPESYPEVFYPKEKALYVLEMKEGAAERRGLNAGSSLTLKSILSLRNDTER